MQIFIPVLLAVGIAIAIAIFSKFAAGSQMSNLRNQLNALKKISKQEAASRVYQMCEHKIIEIVRNCESQDSRLQELQLGQATKDFFNSFSKITGDRFEFSFSRSIRRIGKHNYFTVGFSNQDETTYLVRESDDTVFALDKEDSDIDFEIRLPSVNIPLQSEVGQSIVGIGRLVS